MLEFYCPIYTFIISFLPVAVFCYCDFFLLFLVPAFLIAHGDHQVVQVNDLIWVILYFSLCVHVYVHTHTRKYIYIKVCLSFTKVYNFLYLAFTIQIYLIEMFLNRLIYFCLSFNIPRYKCTTGSLAILLVMGIQFVSNLLPLYCNKYCNEHHSTYVIKYSYF